MRSIRKPKEPHALRHWKREMQKSPQNLSYANIPRHVRDRIEADLLREQGYLCAYTMQRLTEGECHIEHVRPQNAAPELDLDYGNMAACFPQDGGNTSPGYGAPIKAGTDVVLNENFISPHSRGCEQRFHYDRKGDITPAVDDRAAEETIRILRLDHNTLKELRERAIASHGVVLRKGSMRSARKRKGTVQVRGVKLISATQARRLAEKVLQPSSDGRLEPFCVAIAQAANAYAAKEEARAKRMRTQHGDNC